MGEYTVRGLHGKWVFWDISPSESLLCLVSASYPRIPNPLYAEGTLEAELIQKLNEQLPNTDYIYVPLSYAKKVHKEVIQPPLF